MLTKREVILMGILFSFGVVMAIISSCNDNQNTAPEVDYAAQLPDNAQFSVSNSNYLTLKIDEWQDVEYFGWHDELPEAKQILAKRYLEIMNNER